MIMPGMVFKTIKRVTKMKTFILVWVGLLPLLLFAACEKEVNLLAETESRQRLLMTEAPVLSRRNIL